MTDTEDRVPTTPVARRADPVGFLGFDPFDPAFKADPYPHYRRFSASGPLRRTPSGPWVTASYSVCTQVLRDPRFGRWARTGGPAPEAEAAKGLNFMMQDPPDHTRLRRLAGKAFTPRAVERMRPWIEELARDVVEGVSGRVDLLDALARPLATRAIGELLGVPAADHDRLAAWSEACIRALDPLPLQPVDLRPRMLEARAGFAGYFRGLIADRRAGAVPAPRAGGADLPDPLGDLIRARDEEGALNEDELLATCRLLFVAGHETTIHAIANSTLALLRHPDRMAWLKRHPEVLPEAVEELMRFDSPTHLLWRVALEDMELESTRITEGEVVILLVGAANRDPAAFTDPDLLDLTRYGGTVPRHLTFGSGIHFCSGAALARLEIQACLGRLIARDPVLDAGPLDYSPGVAGRGLDRLPVIIG
ncbi:cytochrome P450 [Actinomadura harenae]|uniref:cytochrome P450 n=1 Tax=Actinomadura harenae TaxID=2483351 RepID=UPI0013153767|nr:cytochrome P450 [Actinomadura harenae]